MPVENLLEESLAVYMTDDRGVLSLINVIREGLNYQTYNAVANASSFSTQEWSVILDVSERTLQRYKKEKLKFNSLHSERILQIAMLNKLGSQVFGEKESFEHWLKTENLALGKSKPKDLLDSTFGIEMVKDELHRIEHGVLA